MLLRNYFYYKQFEQYWCSLYWYRYYYFYLVNGFRHNLSILRWKNYAKKLKRRAFSLYQCDGKVVGRRKRYWRTNYLTELCLWFKYREDLFKKRYYTREMYYWCVCISRYNLNIARMSWRIKKAKYSKLFFFNIVNSIPLIFGGFQMQKSLDIYLSTNLFVYGMNIYYRKKKYRNSILKFIFESTETRLWFYTVFSNFGFNFNCYNNIINFNTILLFSACIDTSVANTALEVINFVKKLNRTVEVLSKRYLIHYFTFGYQYFGYTLVDINFENNFINCIEEFYCFCNYYMFAESLEFYKVFCIISYISSNILL